MDTNTTHQSKRQWRFNRPHRVRLFIDQLHINEAYKLSKAELFWQMADKFKDTAQYVWAESNGIEIKYEVDERNVDWFKQVRFFADLSDAEYTDYCLRFFNHYDETWR